MPCDPTPPDLKSHSDDSVSPNPNLVTPEVTPEDLEKLNKILSSGDQQGPYLESTPAESLYGRAAGGGKSSALFDKMVGNLRSYQRRAPRLLIIVTSDDVVERLPLDPDAVVKPVPGDELDFRGNRWTVLRRYITAVANTPCIYLYLVPPSRETFVTEKIDEETGNYVLRLEGASVV